MSDYLLGMSPAEVERLRRQHDVWRRHTERVWELAGFGVGQTIVDLGCGPGFTSLELARRVGMPGRVVAIDASPTATAHLRDAAARLAGVNLEIVTADVGAVDLSVWKPHGVFARWLFSFLPDPAAIVAKLAAAMSSGATMVVMDYANYLAVQTEPASPIFKRVFRAVYDSFADAGGSLDVAGMLPAIFDAHGLQVTRTEPCAQAGSPGSALWRWLDEFQMLYLPRLVENGFLTAVELDEYTRWWAGISAMPNALLFAPPILAVVGVKS